MSFEQSSGSESLEAQEQQTEFVLEQWTLDLFDPIAQKAGFADYTIVPSSGSNVGDGFMGIVMRVLIKGQRNGSEDTLSLMLKMPPLSKTRQKAFSTASLFERESYVYRQVFPTYADFQRSKGLTEDDVDGFFRYPICHAIVADAALDRYAIVMEDLKEAKYVMFDKYQVVDWEHIRFFISELAKMHAVAFALRDQQPKVFKPYSELKCVFLDCIFKNQQKMMEGFQTTLFGMAVESLHPDELELRRKVQALGDNFVEHMGDCVRLSEEREPLSVVNHGDCWINNMMFLYENEVSFIIP